MKDLEFFFSMELSGSYSMSKLKKDFISKLNSPTRSCVEIF